MSAEEVTVQGRVRPVPRTQRRAALCRVTPASVRPNLSAPRPAVRDLCADGCGRRPIGPNTPPGEGAKFRALVGCRWVRLSTSNVF